MRLSKKQQRQVDRYMRLSLAESEVRELGNLFEMWLPGVTFYDHEA